MITLKNLPSSYQPYESLLICSNKLVGGGHFIMVGDVIPFVIGKGDTPRIWLQAMYKEGKENKFTTIIENSIPKYPKVNVYKDGSGIKVNIEGNLILSAREIDLNNLEIEAVDFRPIGFNVYGSQGGLQVGEASLSGNMMSGAQALIGFRDEKNEVEKAETSRPGV